VEAISIAPAHAVDGFRFRATHPARLPGSPSGLSEFPKNGTHPKVRCLSVGVVGQNAYPGRSGMAVHFNHTILSASDSKASAKFLTEMLNLPAPKHWGPFEMVVTENGAYLDYMDTHEITPQHYAFLVSEAEFDEIFGRVRQRNLAYWADPARKQPGEINHHDGGRGVYFEDLNGHLLEIITRPYGSGGWNP
jgi:catechol 2,3-dioxygenase-like lactoylglutathione lyase family enzyme